jgi:hypothetical protein
MSLKRQLSVAAAIAACCVTAGVTQESASIKELARRQGGSATIVVNSEFPLLTVDRLVSESDLIVRGRIEKAVAILSEDESLVLTDYTLRPLDLIKQPAQFGSLAAPGVLPSIKVEVVGGDLLLEGLHLRTESDLHRNTTQLEVGTEYVFFLGAARSKVSKQVRPGVFVPTAGVFGILPIRQGILTNFTASVSARRVLPTDDPSAFGQMVRASAGRAKP